MLYICKIDIYFESNCTNINNFHSPEVVGRGSETQLQVGENLNFQPAPQKMFDQYNLN